MHHAPVIDVKVRAEIEALLTEQCYLIDRGMLDRLPDLFTEGGVFAIPGVEMKGRDQIRAAMAKRPENRIASHAISNVRLVEDGPDRVLSEFTLTVHRFDGEAPGPATPLVVGFVKQVIVREADGHWRLAEHRLTPMFGGH